VGRFKGAYPAGEQLSYQTDNVKEINQCFPRSFRQSFSTAVFIAWQPAHCNRGAQYRYYRFRLTQGNRRMGAASLSGEPGPWKIRDIDADRLHS
jgi:hypothetical protein